MTTTLGGVVHRQFLVYDADGNLTNPAAATLDVLNPNGTTTTLTGSLTSPAIGTREIDWKPAAVGRHVLRFRTTTPDTALDVEVDVIAATGEPRVALADVKAYLGTTSWTDPEITAAITAELAAQDRVCRTAPEYPADLLEALKRRVARNLALRPLPLGAQATGDAGALYVPRTDVEIRRLEAPHRKMSERVG